MKNKNNNPKVFKKLLDNLIELTCNNQWKILVQDLKQITNLWPKI